jgi:hypothetical protein
MRKNQSGGENLQCFYYCLRLCRVLGGSLGGVLDEKKG